MLKRYVYKNVNKRPINIGGYQFTEGQELESDVLINGFHEAVSNGFLELTERKPDGEEPDATQAPQTGDTGKVKVIFHMGSLDGKEVLKEVEIDPNTPVELPGAETLPKPDFEGWFKDAELTKPINVDKAKAPKEGDLHFYAKYKVIKQEDTPPVDPNPSGDAGSEQKGGQVTLPPLPPPPPTPSTGEESAQVGPENK
jgi:hypothetical protein